MQVEALFPDLGSGTLELRMSRSSPGRYSLHDFAKNVYDVHAFGADGKELETTRPDPYGWNVAGHGGSLIVKYKVFGDRVDGTYLGIDTTHAHINMPAAIMWAHGLDDRPVTVNFEQPAGMRWQVATQLHPGSSSLEFTAESRTVTVRPVFASVCVYMKRSPRITVTGRSLVTMSDQTGLFRTAAAAESTGAALSRLFWSRFH